MTLQTLHIVTMENVELVAWITLKAPVAPGRARALFILYIYIYLRR